MSLIQCINSTIQNAINNIFFVMLYSNMLNVLYLAFSLLLFLADTAYQISTICLVGRYEETPVLQNVYE